MKELIVTKPDNCPLREEDFAVCGLDLMIDCRVEFPPDCPLFENDYLIKRRIENVL